jgi:hypothetical protein
MIENKRSNWAWLIKRGREERLTTARRKKKRKKSWEGGVEAFGEWERKGPQKEEERGRRDK